MAMNTVFLHLSEEAIKRLNKLRGWRKVHDLQFYAKR